MLPPFSKSEFSVLPINPISQPHRLTSRSLVGTAFIRANQHHSCHPDLSTTSVFCIIIFRRSSTPVSSRHTLPSWLRCLFTSGLDPSVCLINHVVKDDNNGKLGRLATTMEEVTALSTSSILTQLLQDLRVGNKYRIGRKIGSGSFGDIYLGMKASRSKYLNL